MSDLLSVFAQAPTPVIDDTYNSPGTVGFFATFLVAVGAVLLFVDMARRIRRARYREDVRNKLRSAEVSPKPSKAKGPNKAS